MPGKKVRKPRDKREPKKGSVKESTAVAIPLEFDEAMAALLAAKPPKKS